MELKGFFSKSGLIILYILVFILLGFMIIVLTVVKFTPLIFGYVPLIFFIVLLFIKSISFKKKLLYFVPMLVFFLIIILIPFRETSSGGNADLEYLTKNTGYNLTCLKEQYGDREGFSKATSAVRECGACIGVLRNFFPGMLDIESCVGFMKCTCYVPENICNNITYIPCSAVDSAYE